jgi:hypothetical protein
VILRTTSLLALLGLTRSLSVGGGGDTGPVGSAQPGDPQPGDEQPGLPAVASATDLSAPPIVEAGPGTPGTGLATRDLVVGDGTEAALTDTVRIQYMGALYATGEVFDATWSRGGQPATFPLNGVVPGFAQGIAGMKVGGRRQIVIPPDLGYGARTNGPIPGGSTLVFVVDLLAIQ